MINYGFTTALVSKNKFKWDLSVNPYVAGQISIKDSASYIPGLMLPGTTGIKINNFFRFNITPNNTLAIMPFCFGYKLITNFGDSVNVLAQHNFRSGIAFRHMQDLFILGFQYTLAWHNSTSQSEASFEKVFNSRVTDVQYITISLQTALPGLKSSFLFAEWRGMMFSERLRDLPNTKIISLGVRIDITFENAAPAGSTRSGAIRFVSGF